MERCDHTGLAWSQGPSPTDWRPPGALEGSFPDAWAATQPVEPYASSYAAFQESPALPPALDLLVPDTLRVQESQIDQSRVKKPKSRTTFSQEQLRLLRKDFKAYRYITQERGYQLAQMLGLSYKQVKTWFQNQRLKAKRSQAVPVCTAHTQDARLPQLEPPVGPQSFSLPPSLDPVSNRPENNSGWRNQVSEDYLQNYGEAASPYQMAFQSPYPANPMEAPVKHAGWNYPIGSQSSLAPCAPDTMQAHLPPLNTSVQVQLEWSSSDISEASSASAPSPNDSGAPWDQFYPLLGPVLSAP